MTTDNDSVRADFEEWASPILDLKGSRLRVGKYMDGATQAAWAAWQASRERYVPSIEQVETNNLHLRELVRHLRLCAECAEFDVTGCETGRPLWMAAMVQATPNGGNGE